MGNYDLHFRGETWRNLTEEQKAHLLNSKSDSQLEEYIVDQRCNQRWDCEKALAERRRTGRGGPGSEVADGTGEIAAELKVEPIPFNPRRDVSADAVYIAGHIVKHLWIIFVLLPLVLGVLFAILK
jgi:hypothetical protein